MSGTVKKGFGALKLLIGLEIVTLAGAWGAFYG
jgi:hypothetical protein